MTYGKIGTDGQSVTRKFKSSDAALTEAEKQISEKTKKGYVEVISANNLERSGWTECMAHHFQTTEVPKREDSVLALYRKGPVDDEVIEENFSVPDGIDCESDAYLDDYDWDILAQVILHK